LSSATPPRSPIATPAVKKRHDLGTVPVRGRP
jgi:hypothetical protein